MSDMVVEQVEFLIKDCSFLLPHQKDKLVQKISDELYVRERLFEPHSSPRHLLDNVLYKLQSKRLHDLSPLEMMDVNFVLKDLGYGCIE